jgi:hypothetical protein
MTNSGGWRHRSSLTRLPARPFNLQLWSTKPGCDFVSA